MLHMTTLPPDKTKNAMVANYKQNYDNAMAACKEQIKHPPEAEATVYARKGINLPINDCLAVLTGDEPFDTFYLSDENQIRLNHAKAV